MIALPEVKHVIAIASGKGGVGKSTVAVNLALALLQEGQATGLLDADIYGPSLPLLLGLSELHEDARAPVERYGLQTMSIGYFLSPDTPAIWRGPMASKYLQELFGGTLWKKLDYLIVDLPPGTGDIQLTLSQKIRTAGALIITTPQDIALIDAKKAIKMFEKVNVPVLGVIENMSGYVCSACGQAENIFGQGGGEKIAREQSVELLGQIPLLADIRAYSDAGKPFVFAKPDSAVAQLYRQTARRVIQKIEGHIKKISLLKNIPVKNI